MTKFKYKGRRFLVDGSDVTATAAELNRLSGATVTAAEINTVAGVTAGTVAASKALVVDANKDLATLRHLTISGNLVTGTTTLSEAELGVLDGVTVGTAAASKAVVLDANKGVTAFRHAGVPLFVQATPAAVDTSATMTAANLLTQYVTSSTAAAVAGTLPLATAMESALVALQAGLQNDDCFDFSVTATGANAFTVTTNTGWTLVGSMVVATGTTGSFRVRRTSATTYVCYRL